ncbi:MAG: prepilin-type N-terminal cleavage/methylation domain-containing protein [Coriobacteriia bacterium]|nr:prepilin-type N-terminal cleavage/methylation domain-containing protein [Coriobacteriia bacterium]
MGARCQKRTDDGFTLAELLVVVALLGFVLGGAYALLTLIQKGSVQSDQQAWISREIGQPLEHLERLFSQRVPWATSDPDVPIVGDAYVCWVKTDQDRDDHYEIHGFEVTSDGRLTEVYSEQIDNPTARTRVWSGHNANRAAAVPLFRYLDIDGTDISGEDSTYIKQYAASVIITVVTEYDEKQFSDSRQVFFRNR